MNIQFCPTCHARMYGTTRGSYCPACRHEITALSKAFSYFGGLAVSLPQEKHKEESKPMKVSYKGATGKLRKLEHGYNPYMDRDGYVLEIVDAEDGHKHVFENVDVSEIKFIGAKVTLA